MTVFNENPHRSVSSQRSRYGARSKDELHRLGIATDDERARVEAWDSGLANRSFLVEEEKLGDLAQHRILDKLERYGICQLRPVGMPATHELVESLIDMIGTPTDRQNAVVGRVKDIRPRSGFKPNTGNSSGDLGLHVDGTQTLAQPPILLFQYVTGATFGARSRFADAARVLHDLSIADRTGVLTTLSRPDAASFVKGDQRFIGPMFEISPHQTLKCRIRFDDVLTVNPRYRRQYQKLTRSFADPFYSLTIQPRDGDIVLVDNWRILHARTEVYGTRERHHRRVWFANLKLELQPKYYLGVRPLCPALLAKIHAVSTPR